MTIHQSKAEKNYSYSFAAEKISKPPNILGNYEGELLAIITRAL